MVHISAKFSAEDVGLVIRGFVIGYSLLGTGNWRRSHIFPDSPPGPLSAAPKRDLAEMGSFMVQFQSNGNGTKRL